MTPIQLDRPSDVLPDRSEFTPGRSTFPEMTVRENLETSAYLKDEIDEELQTVYERFPILQEKASNGAKTLSGGQQQMLEIAGALMMDPDLLLLDEPSLGLAPKVATRIFDRIRALNEEGVSFFIIEQNARRALEASARAYVTDQGQIALQGVSDDLLENGDVQRLCLGGRPQRTSRSGQHDGIDLHSHCRDRVQVSPINKKTCRFGFSCRRDSYRSPRRDRPSMACSRHLPSPHSLRHRSPEHPGRSVRPSSYTPR